MEKTLDVKKSKSNPHKGEIKAATRKAAKPLLYLGMVSIVMLFAGLTSAYVVRADGTALPCLANAVEMIPRNSTPPITPRLISPVPIVCHSQAPRGMVTGSPPTKAIRLNASTSRF